MARDHRPRASGSPTALDELYAYYEGTEAMLDERAARRGAGPRRRARPGGFRAFLDDAAALSPRAGARGAGAARWSLAAARHAVDFDTWRSLAREGGVSRARAVELTSAMVLRAAGR